ncbi:serine/threonine-protein kinase [Gloeothece verrucosa]|uniref:non-specific serine/threonine protein kinase n=1 Tax=Gloeothece verrucosa (strain PCC 7822) TaxID=497965 RepID=E0U5Z3_GLOV7|nr:serine/threonine-protein kinase [Gloeothece verrucosa]ADN17102.1 serine/threonine protein kinase [Gloeothece verrucosa PCC 7822]
MMNISQCINPDCLAKNPPEHKFCLKCGAKLLLRDHYRAVRYIGEGGFGRTFEAVDEDRLNTPCVIKQFLPFQGGTQSLNKATELFKREAEQLRELGKHPQIPDLLSYFEQDGRLYLIQEYIEGQDLLKEHQQGRFSEAKTRQLLKDLLPILQFIHQKNVIHRDIKPENIIRRLDGSLVLIDFGIAKQLDLSGASRMGTITGTLGYAAPEQMRGVVQPASDLYSLGLTAIRLLTGCLPDDGAIDPLYDPIEMKWVWWQWAKQNGINVSSQLAKILDKMVRERMKERYQSAAEVLEVLNRETTEFSKGTVIQNEPVSLPRTYQEASAKKVSTLSQSQVLPKLSVKLYSSSGMDYGQLHDLLVEGKWEQANRETAKVILRAAGREKQGRLVDTRGLCTEDLQIIDQLWVQASKGRFGFSVQKRLWSLFNFKDDSATEQDLGRILGWFQKGKWLNYGDLQFSIDAREGHLPVVWGISRVDDWAGVFYFLSEIIKAGLLD